jgi:Putative transposase, YhgA-like
MSKKFEGGIMTEITANYDDTWKYAISCDFESCLIFFYPDIHAQIDWTKTPVPLEKELAKITAAAKTDKRHADKLFKVWLLTGEEAWILIHIEVQSQYDNQFPLRMFIYNYRAFDLHKQPVISLAILGDESGSWRPTSYQYGMGKSQVTMEFNTVKLLDYKWEELEQRLFSSNGN